MRNKKRGVEIFFTAIFKGAHGGELSVSGINPLNRYKVRLSPCKDAMTGLRTPEQQKRLRISTMVNTADQFVTKRP